MDIDDYTETLRSRLAVCRLTREQLAAATGGRLSASWLSKFAAGHMTNPRIDSLKVLDLALRSCESNPQGVSAMTKTAAIGMFGATVTEMARALGVTRSAISQWPEVLRQEQVDRVIGAAVRLGLWRPDEPSQDKAA